MKGSHHDIHTDRQTKKKLRCVLWLYVFYGWYGCDIRLADWVNILHNNIYSTASLQGFNKAIAPLGCWWASVGLAFAVCSTSQWQYVESASGPSVRDHSDWLFSFANEFCMRIKASTEVKTTQTEGYSNFMPYLSIPKCEYFHNNMSLLEWRKWSTWVIASATLLTVCISAVLVFGFSF